MKVGDEVDFMFDGVNEIGIVCYSKEDTQKLSIYKDNREICYIEETIWCEKVNNEQNTKEIK